MVRWTYLSHPLTPTPTASRSVRPLLHSTFVWPTHRQTDHTTCEICRNRPHLARAPAVKIYRELAYNNYKTMNVPQKSIANNTHEFCPKQHKSPLPLTDPRTQWLMPTVLHTDVDGHYVINWWPRPSPVCHTDRSPKLTAPETIISSRHMVGAHQNLNGSRDLTTPLPVVVCHPWASTCWRQPIYQIWNVYRYSLRRYERRYKMSKMWWIGVVRVSQGHWKVEISSVDRTHMSVP